MSKLSAADEKYLSDGQKQEIIKLKGDWDKAYAAGDTAGMQAANKAAEAIRAGAGYSGGADGSGYRPLSGGADGSGYRPENGGMSAADVQKWVDEYHYINLDKDSGWVNGFSADMNMRSMANFIRQQMKANSDAWASADEAGKQYLHDQNVQLAEILSKAAGGVQSTYNEELGRWETENANLGYGYNTGSYNDLDFVRDFYGMTDEQIEAYRNDTDRYRNFVDQGIIRNWVDESSGYTGRYSHFVNGPYGQLLKGTKEVNPTAYHDLIGDGFGLGEPHNFYVAPRDEYGNIVPQAPMIKDTNAMTDYTKGKSSYVDENGVIQPGTLLKTNPAGAGVDRIVPHGSGVRTSSEKMDASGTLEQWQQSAMEQAAAARDHAVDQAVQALLLAQKEAEAEYQARRDQIAREERNALDNSALYAETRGDRGGIGRSQYDYIQAQANANRQAVATAQTKLASETTQQIAKLRAQGEFEKADEMMEISQTYLLKLLEMEKWAAQYELDTKKFEESIRQWESEYLLRLANAMI